MSPHADFWRRKEERKKRRKKEKEKENRNRVRACVCMSAVGGEMPPPPRAAAHTLPSFQFHRHLLQTNCELS